MSNPTPSSMNFRILINCFLLIAIFGSLGCKPEPDAQKVNVMNKVSGFVLGETKKGLPGAIIVIKGTDSGTATDINGEFAIQLPFENAVLVISYPEYFSKEVTVTNESGLEVILEKEESQFKKVNLE